MTPSFPLRLLLAGCALACATPARAQEIVFSQIPWTASPDTVRARLEAQGYTYHGVQDGTRFFMRDDSSYVQVVLRGVEHPVAFYAGEPLPGDRVEARFRVLADSLAARLGPPVDRRPDLLRWEAGLTSAILSIRSYPSGARVVQTAYRGPGFLDEAAVVSGGSGVPLPDLPAGYTTVSQSDGMRVAIDTSSISSLAGGWLRARYRVDYPQPRNDAGDRYDAIEYAMDFDCGGGRTRLYSRTTILSGRRRPTASAAGLPWRAARAGSEEARALDGVCRAKGRGPAAAARPGQTRSFGPVPAGWVVIGEGEEGRWIVETASIAARAGGIMAASMRVEYGASQPGPFGRFDGMRMRVEVDCAGKRMRYTSGTLQNAGRDLHDIPVPPQQAAWAPAGNTGIIDAVCPAQ